MGTYNTLRTEITCPHCSTLVNVEIELFFGDTRMMDRFELGDLYKWVPERSAQHGGRPDRGDMDGEGYTECPGCGRDFFVKVMVRGDRIQRVEPNMEKAVYIQPSDLTRKPSSEEVTRPSTADSVRKSGPGKRGIGRITYNEKWALNTSIQEILEDLIRFGVDIYSTRGGSDYTILIPLDLSREQMQDVERLMKKLGKQVHGKVNYVDWYPHGWKYRIEPHEKNA